jgi:hypothetical protein
MQENIFIKLDRLESENLLQEINPVIDGSPFAPATATVLAQALSFYPGYRYIEIADYEAHPPRRRFVIHKPRDVVAINGSNEPLYALNERAPIALNDNTVSDYVRFFFSNVRGRHGRFLITENVDDIQWREEPPPAARKAIGKILVPLTVTARENDGGYRLSACMMFKDSLFKANVTVRRDGVVSLSDEELLIEDMPVLDDTFGQ